MITIIIPFYNTEKYFNICLSSIRTQTFSDFEVLLIDDGSTDSSRTIAQHYVDQDSRFILINNTHIGYPACKNLGLDIAKGEYICFIDSDDFIEPQHLENLYKNLISTNSDISSCDFSYIKTTNDEKLINPYTNKIRTFEGAENIIYRYFTNTYPWTKLFKKSLFDELRFQNVEALSDMLLNYLVFERAHRTVYSTYKSYHYRVHDNSITYNVRNYSSTYWPYRVNVYIQVFSYIAKKYPNLRRYAKNRVYNEFQFCLPHLTEAQKIEFNNNSSLQNLLY